MLPSFQYVMTRTATLVTGARYYNMACGWYKMVILNPLVAFTLWPVCAIEDLENDTEHTIGILTPSPML